MTSSGGNLCGLRVFTTRKISSRRLTSFSAKLQCLRLVLPSSLLRYRLTARLSAQDVLRIGQRKDRALAPQRRGRGVQVARVTSLSGHAVGGNRLAHGGVRRREQFLEAPVCRGSC